jgi:hypothetical protein
MRPIAVQRLLAYAASIALCLALGAALAVAFAADPPPDVEALKRDAAAVRDSPQKAMALAALAKLNWQTDQEAALRYANEGLAIADRIGDDRARAANLNAIGAVHLLRGEYDAARRSGAVALNEATGNAKEADAWRRTSATYAARNDNDAALAAMRGRPGWRARDDAGLATVNDGTRGSLPRGDRRARALADYAAKAGDDRAARSR